MKEYIINIKNDLLNYVNGLRDLYLANKNSAKYEIKYMIAKEIYEDFLLLADEKSIKDYLNKLYNKSLKTNMIYNNLYSEYEKEKDNNKKRTLQIDINECVARLNAYNECYNIISNGLINKKEFINEDTKTSDYIISLLIKYYSLDSKSESAKKILKEVFELRCEREKSFKDLYGSNYRIYISILESIENMAAMTNKEEFKPYEMDSGKYYFELRNVINAINEYYFINELHIKKFYKSNINDKDTGIKFYKKFTNYLRKYHVLIKSLFNNNSVEFTVENETIDSDDLLSYLSTCNLDGDFSVYRSKFSNNQIGTNNADRKQYIESLIFLNKCINSLCDKAYQKLGDKNIMIVDNELTFDDIIKMRNDKLVEIYSKKDQKQSNNKGKLL